MAPCKKNSLLAALPLVNSQLGTNVLSSSKNYNLSSIFLGKMPLPQPGDRDGRCRAVTERLRGRSQELKGSMRSYGTK